MDKELEAQIEEMKCCGNCEHFDFAEPNYCNKGVYRERLYVCGKWSLGPLKLKGAKRKWLKSLKKQRS